MLKVTPLEDHSFGAIVSGATVQEILKSVDLQNELVDAFNKNGLVILQKQELTPSEEFAIAKLFPHDAEAPITERAGPYSADFKKWKLPEIPEIQVQGWGKLEDHYGVSGTMAPKVETREWHTDGIHELKCPCVLTSVYAVSVPPVGGETLFASGYEVWDALEPKQRAEVGKLHVRYTMRQNRMSEDGTHATIGVETNVANGPDAKILRTQTPDTQTFRLHPMFRLHPHTSRPALSVAPLYMHSIDGMNEKDACALVSKMIQLAMPGMYAHRFEKGDFVLWDNRCLLHSASPNLHRQGLRLLHRIRMSSKEVPIPAISCDDDPEEKVRQLEEASKAEPPSKRMRLIVT